MQYLQEITVNAHCFQQITETQQQNKKMREALDIELSKISRNPAVLNLPVHFKLDSTIFCKHKHNQLTRNYLCRNERRFSHRRHLQ